VLSTDGLCVVDGPQVGGGRFVFRGVLLEVRVAFLDGPRQHSRQSARVPRTVPTVRTVCPCPGRQLVALPLVICFRF
jgi:hypothetical protein